MVDEEDETVWPVLAARAADDKLGADTVVLDVGDVLAITGHFVITSARNERSVRTIAEEVEARIAGDGGPRPLRIGRIEHDNIGGAA